VAQLFSPASNQLARGSLLAAVGGLIVAAFLATWLSRSEWSTGQAWTRSQPVQFSHFHHVGGIGIDCEYCHRTVATERFAGIPPTEICMHCHSQLWTHSEMLGLVRESWATGTPLRWQRIHDLPDFAYFDHSAHVQAGVGCATCHGDVASMPLVTQQASLLMRWCVDCHEHLEQRYGLPNKTSCSTCHR
jgi:hypothetical protein